MMASSPAVTCSPVATTASYSRASKMCRSLSASSHHVTSRSVVAGHGRNHDGDFMTGVDLALDVTRDVADAVDIGDRSAAEFHDETGHVVVRVRFSR